MLYGGCFDVDKADEKLEEYNKLISSPDFWADNEKAEKIMMEKNNIEKKANNIKKLKEEIISNIELVEFLKIEEDAETKKLLEENIEMVGKELEAFEVQLLLNKPYDKKDAILEIHTGAGGTEANDWVAMLYRMYLRYFEKNNYKYDVLSESKGEEVGYKSVSILVKNEYAYGYLKYEHGVHRLVRISPFDSNSRRHTSFAFVDVVPYFDEEVEITIDDKDLKIDVYKSSGAGGQSVNTTDSAVRITHLPTGTVVTCQNERSQIKNRETALNVLKNKLWTLEVAKKEESIKEIRGETIDINFGSQIRSYVLHPYSLIKDHRTNTESSNVTKVLDGDIEIFINDNLKKGSWENVFDKIN